MRNLLTFRHDSASEIAFAPESLIENVTVHASGNGIWRNVDPWLVSTAIRAASLPGDSSASYVGNGEQVLAMPLRAICPELLT